VIDVHVTREQARHHVCHYRAIRLSAGIEALSESVVPTAPMATFGIVYQSRGIVPLVYIVGLIAMVFTALSYLMMSRAFPLAGSVYAYAGRSTGESAGFLADWAMLLEVYGGTSIHLCGDLRCNPRSAARSAKKGEHCTLRRLQ